ncbi:MAG: Serine/threonine exchanger SteT [Chroococcidiopsis cubana SAG 39.79]|uniref:Amino acid transporter n=1 Tax=Chroococcidiopsis cubana SAG 39.79 TaxID=388085 RepID=A0AB37UBV0_9CYAN|nr:amino acid permease [Chroococcidiopsis cubana]MDZ4875741.1 Serine/threonine exchanger SteT [Chroococcidiopsis cubana SAG 39.79]PSB63423.1 amino acid permease [Chroococcidiopsis cubana CCALA 043]RUT04952.1 amino acid transporter [Chroococcidiopsis cubana SAG 39.79]
MRRKQHSQAAIAKVASPKPSLAFVDAVALIVGIVIGAGIFETPALVAANVSSNAALMLTWLVGGAISLVGALCYAELATAYPHVGGNYYYLKRSFGQRVAFLFAWARMTVVQTGSIALLAFVFGDYASRILGLGTFSASVYAAGAIALFTTLNIFGLQQGKRTQNLLTVATVLGLLLIVIIGIAFATPTSIPATESTNSGGWGLAMLFVLLSYGGWNEAAYISAEIQNRQRNIVRSLLWSIGIITVIYFLVNLAYLKGLGLEAMGQSQAVAADLMQQALGDRGAIIISLLIVIASLGSLNATIFTGARSNYALGQDFPRLSFLKLSGSRSSPTGAMLVQGAISIALVVLGTLTRRGFETMVDFTAPVFWFFFLLTGISLLVLRMREPDVQRPFQVPLYPLTPLLFCVVCAYLFYSSLAYTGIGAIASILVVGLGIPLWQWHQSN